MAAKLDTPPAFDVDLDQRGSLSIVVQGPLFQGNMIETANHCRHWRDMFPDAEIILSLSLSDIVVGERQGGLLTTLELVPRHRHDGHLVAALQLLTATCDKICFAESALPLPPIKSDTPKLNNMNLQLAAAKQGLSLASGTYVLRIRSDLIFLNRSFLDQYAAGIELPRQHAAVFEERVLISWLYTLNPFTVERLPLHFSDWFHFGLLSDVRRIWSAPPITLADSMYYRTHAHNPDSNVLERLFNTRLAVEQHIAYECFKDSFESLVLDYHNDWTSVDLAMDILIDNFVVCDLAKSHCIFNKYAHELYDPEKKAQCITAEAWASLAHLRPADYREITREAWLALSQPVRDEAESAEYHADTESEEAFHLQRQFPRTYSAGRLRTRIGRLVDEQIKADSVDGVLLYGPYITLEPGRYLARLEIASIQGPGSVTITVTGSGGDIVLAKGKVSVGTAVITEIKIPFDVVGNSVSDLELVCSVRGLRSISVSGLTISERPDLPRATSATARFRDMLLGRGVMAGNR